MIIADGNVYTDRFRFEKKHIRITDGRYDKISDAPILPEAGEEVINAKGFKVLPGLMDVHFHGCMGKDLCDGDTDAIVSMAEYEYSVGVTYICPATMTLPLDRVEAICRTAVRYREYCAHKPDGRAELVGINLEGPFISPDRVGAQSPEYVIKPDVTSIERLLEASEGLAKLMTIAPEVAGATECIKKLGKKIHMSVGHTTADYDDAAAGFEAGADHVTHLYNAMKPLTHREPGVIGAAAERENVMAELICDGVHVHPAAVKAAYRLFGEERLILISDSMRACGMPDGEYELGGIPVIKKGREARQHNGTIAGSVTNLYDCMLHAMSIGITAEAAIRSATYNPACSIGMGNEYGLIKEGYHAHSLLTDNEYSLVRVI